MKHIKHIDSFIINEAARIGNSSWSSILRDLKYDGWEIKGNSAYKSYEGDDGDERKLELSNYGGDEVEWTIYDGKGKEINSGSFDAEGLSAGELDSEVWSNIEESVSEAKEISAEELVKKIVKGNSRFKWLINDLPKNYTIDDVKTALDDAGYGKEYEKYIEESVSEAKEISIKDYKVGDVISFKDGEDWKVTKVKYDKLMVKPHNEKAKKSNTSIEIDIDLDYLKNNLAESAINEGRTIEKIEKDRTKVVNDMAEIVTNWKAAKESGDKKAEASFLQRLKDLTAQKKGLEKELNIAIAGKDRDVELVISEAEDVKKGIHDHWKELYGEDFVSAYPKVAKILKNRQNVDRRELARIWDETYGEDFKEKYAKIWDVLD